MTDSPAARAEPDLDDLAELRDLWMSRLVFNPVVGWPPETRTFDEFVRDHTGEVSDV